MKKLQFLGDGLLGGLSGYGEMLAGLFFLERPESDIVLHSYTSEGMTFQEALRDAPIHVIGKAPDILFLALGYKDMEGEIDLHSVGESAFSLVKLLLQKTSANLYIANLCPELYSEETSTRARINTFNPILETLRSERIQILDVATPVSAFLAKHRLSPGEQRSIHANSNRLTVLGKLLFSRIVFSKLLPAWT